VIRNHFAWAYRSTKDGNYRRYRRHLDYDDLASEGCVALIEAWERWHKGGGASFKTYAFTAIYRKIHRFIDANASPITTRDWQSVSKYDDSVHELLAAAITCRLFSESTVHGHRIETVPEIAGDKSDFSPHDILHADWVQFCMDRLEKAMKPKDLRILLERADGRTFTQIGEKRGITRERARVVYGELIVRAAVALLDQEKSCG
jgi:RNA polymerase sigma factor (sigma-70 family)